MSSFNINRVVLVGHLTRDPELRAVASGGSVCSLRIALNSRHREADGEYGERPNYFDVSVFGPAAEVVSEHTSKGSQVGIDGRLSWREWETAEETKRQAVSVIADTVQFLGRPARHDGDDDGEADGGEDDPDLAGIGAGTEDIPF
jgi:single-strand DNA-binding protein